MNDSMTDPSNPTQYPKVSRARAVHTAEAIVPRHPAVGVILDVVGGILALCALVFAIVGANAEAFLVFLVIATGFCFLGEQLRRGNLQNGLKRPESLGVVQARVRPLGTTAHAVWAVVALLIAVFIAIGPSLYAMGAARKGSALEQLLTGDDLDARQVIGVLAVGFGVIPLHSLLKKLAYRAQIATRGAGALNGGPNRRRWRSLTYRWRVDIYIAFLAGVVAAFGLLMPYLGGWSTAHDALLSGVAGIVLLVVAAAIFFAGSRLAAQYWKAGMPLGMGESI